MAPRAPVYIEPSSGSPSPMKSRRMKSFFKPEPLSIFLNSRMPMTKVAMKIGTSTVQDSEFSTWYQPPIHSESDPSTPGGPWPPVQQLANAGLTALPPAEKSLNGFSQSMIVSTMEKSPSTAAVRI